MSGKVWKDALELLKYDSNVSKIIYESILCKMKEEYSSDSVLILSCRDEYSLSHAKSKDLGDAVKNAVRTVSDNPKLNVKFVLEGDTQSLNSTVLSEKAAERQYTPDTSDGLTDEFTFSTFVTGDCNRFAYASAVSVANNPGQTQRNPLYLWGNSGLGKTHLMKAIGYQVRRLYPEKVVLYTTCEQFTNAFVSCINNKSYDSFRRKYRTVDVLLIDDIQFLIGKEGTQTEFFNTFEALVNAGKQIVITSDKMPSNLTELDSRLTSRFQNGIMMDIQPPDFETRKAIFLSKSEAGGLSFDDDIVNFVCENVTVNIRQLNGAYNTLSSYSSVGEVTLDVAQKILAPLISPDADKTLTPEMVINAVAKYYSLTPDKLISQQRKADISEARNIAMIICRDHLDMTLDKIGKIFGGRKHSTVLHGISNVEDNPELKRIATDIVKKLTDG